MASDDEKAHIEQHDAVNSYGPKPTFGQKFKRHCARFWWVHLIIFIIVVLVVVLPIIYVAYPNLAQSNINKSTLGLLSESITNPTPTSIDLDLRSVILSNSSRHPQLDAFDGSFHLEDNDTPFLQFRIPAVKAENGTETHINQRIEITNLEAFSEYTKTNLVSEEYTVRLRGKGGLKLGGLPKTTVNYNQKITTKGFNGLKGLNVTSFRLLETPLPDGANAEGEVFIPNPTVITLAMGNVTLDMSVAGTSIGNATLPNLRLVPGNNSVPIHVTVNQTAVVGVLAIPRFNCGVLQVDIAGKQSIYDGQELTYYSNALQANKLTNELNVRPALEEAGFGFVLGSDEECS